MPFIDRATLDFLLYDWLIADALTRQARFAEHSRETFDAVLDLSARLGDEHFAPHYKRSDRVEPRLDGEAVRVLPEIKAALDIYAKAGLFAASFDQTLGGAQIPILIHTASTAMTMAANIATAAYPMLTVANARLLATFGTPAQIEILARPQIEGRWFGTMCLSEPQAGSSLGDITTRAIADGEDIALGPRYRLFGNKMWISGGDQDASENIVHLVLAKVLGEDGRLGAGLAGISLFAVPKLLPAADGGLGEANDVVVAGLNHKMGYRGTANCLLAFGEGTRHRPAGAAGAIGFRIGEVGQGLAIMFRMMNEARIAVGVGAAALACRGYRHALDYARERTQGRPVNARKDSAPTPIIVHPDVRRMLLTQKVYAEGALALVLYCARLVDEEAVAASDAERDATGQLLGLLTPVGKSWPAEFGLAANDLAIQIHGGYGYTRDFDVEQVYRDNRLNPIHEGTYGIQAIDLVGRKILRSNGDALALLGERIDATLVACGDELSDECAALRAAWAEVEETVAMLRAAGAEKALHNASAFLSAFGHVVVAWLWLDQARASADKVTMRETRRHACRYFFATELPKARQQFAFVRSGNDMAASFPDACL
ncbi:MAG: 3-methylmercaptopropionyl-CoA dehydrogenase (DmdC) [Pseudolabrys sp.]|jgi:alkylation response protein AidB-like acyl-CoA dehydrogenase|nr:3-methylmercaptopropionyl-CoA dehydrogenase (DmdC) [Pseudolabrys sp.]